MSTLDYVVLAIYFLVMATIGVVCSWGIKHQQDYFLGGRSFGKLLQAFAAFGAGTGANDPVTVGRTTYTSGLSGIWSVLYWLFVTPFYWIFAVWYRRMRLLTLGDWFVERYESPALGAAYTIFGIGFYMLYLSVAFSAVGKVCAPLIGADTFDLPVLGQVDIFYVLLPTIAVVTIIYGVLGGLRAAYWTDLIQGIFIILLSVLLIPYGLDALVQKFGTEYAATTGQEVSQLGLMDGFRIMHQQVADEFFQILGSPRSGEFPIYFIIAVTIINLLGIVVQPHFIATGGGSAKTEWNARVGLVVGNFLKRFCTVGWALTALILLALLADSPELSEDPDRVWGLAAREILGPLQLGLVGLMLACLLAALMSSADAYMLVTSALVVRNVYAAYIDPNASEGRYVTVGRCAGFLIIAGAAAVAMIYRDVFTQLKATWEITALFFAPFWVGMLWRYGTKGGAWLTVIFATLVFFLLPKLLPVVLPDLRTNAEYTQTNQIIVEQVSRKSTPADVSRRQAEITTYERRKATAEAIEDADQRASAIEALGPPPEPLGIGETFVDVFRSGGKAIFWTENPTTPEGKTPPTELVSETETKRGTIRVLRYTGPLVGNGEFNLDFLLYEWAGVDLTTLSGPMLETLRLPPKIITPFLLMIFFSLITPRGSQEALDRYFVKMKTPVDPDPEKDDALLAESYANPRRYDDTLLWPVFGLEIQKPSLVTTLGVVIGFVICFAIIGLAAWVAQIGAT